MPDSSPYLQQLGKLLPDLEEIGLQPVLVGGMALVILGSRRVTEDYDFVISQEGLNRKDLMKVFYRNGFELASKIDKNGAIIDTIDNQNVAAARMAIDTPASIYFLNKKTQLRIDLLFDFPLPAKELIRRAEKKKIQSCVFRVASKEDLLRLKEIANQDRNLATDAQDLEFLKNL